jgi:hypothetical protein
LAVSSIDPFLALAPLTNEELMESAKRCEPELMPLMARRTREQQDLRHAFDHPRQLRAGDAAPASELHQLRDSGEERAALRRPDDADSVASA